MSYRRSVQLIDELTTQLGVPVQLTDTLWFARGLFAGSDAQTARCVTWSLTTSCRQMTLTDLSVFITLTLTDSFDSLHKCLLAVRAPSPRHRKNATKTSDN